MKNIGQLMKQAQEMQAKMATMQEELANLTVEGHSGGSMITVTMNCKGEMRKIKIDPNLVNLEEIDILEDLIMAACNDAKAKAEARVSEEMAKITGGLKLPGGMQLLF